MQNQLIALSEPTLRDGLSRGIQVRETKRETSGRIDSMSFQGFCSPFRLGTRGHVSLRWKNTARRGAAQREESLGGQFFRGFSPRNARQVKPRRADPRDIALGLIIAARRPRRTIETNDGDVSRFTARGLVSTGSYDLPLDLWPSKRTR